MAVAEGTMRMALGKAQVETRIGVEDKVEVVLAGMADLQVMDRAPVIYSICSINLI